MSLAAQQRLRSMLMGLMPTATFALNKKILVMERRLLLTGLFPMIMENRASDKKAENLNEILFAYFHAKRYMIENNQVSKDNDDEIRSRFREMLNRQTIKEPRDLDDLYMNVVNVLRPNFEIYRQYHHLHLHMHMFHYSSEPLVTKRQFDNNLFYVSGWNTNTRLREKMIEDVQRLSSFQERWWFNEKY